MQLPDKIWRLSLRYKGTTTDPVLKSMELLPLGPVVLIDTPGLDDEGELGALRIKKAVQMLNKTDIALLVVDGRTGITDKDREILNKIQEKKIPFIIVYNKCDLVRPPYADTQNSVWVSADTGENIDTLKNRIADCVPKERQEKKIVGDLVAPGDFVVLVIPIDDAAPKGRSDFAPAADNAGSFGFRRSRSRRTGYRAKRNPPSVEKNTCSCNHRQPGV